MKLLHSKSTAERILAVSACPCANLFGLVTSSAVTVYRSTTLTTVFTFSLTPFQPADTGGATSVGAVHATRQAEHYRCCWSPSGRLFTVALPSGILLVFDVEGGNLARVLTTSSTRASPSPSIPAAAAASPFSPAASPTAFPAAVPSVITSLPPDRPVLAMTWCAVPSLSSAQLSAMATAVQTRCLPVRLGVTAALFDEAMQGVGSGTATAAGSGGDGTAAPLNLDASHTSKADRAGLRAEEPSATSAFVSLLTVLGSDGVLRFVVGGLCEVYATQLALPSPLVSCGSSWEDVTVFDLQWRQCAVGPGAAVQDGGYEGSGSSSKKETYSSRVAALVSFGDTAVDPVRHAVGQHHRLYLTVCGSTAAPTLDAHDGGKTPLSPQPQPPLLPSHVMWEANLQDRLTALAMPRWLAICHVREYASIAQETYEKVVHAWSRVLRGQVLAHLGLPAAAPLLSAAVVAQLTDPDPIALYKYAKQTLMRAALVEDLEALAKTFHTASYEVTHVCYRCCEAAMACAVYTRGDVEEGDNDDDAAAASLCDANEEASASHPATATSSPSLVSLLGALRRQYEAFLRRAANEGECARDLALWVMQQSIHWESGTHFFMGGGTNTDNNIAAAAYGEEDRRDASPSPVLPPPPQLQQQPVLIDEVPVSATRQPALYSFLIEIMTSAASNRTDFTYASGNGSSHVAEAGDQAEAGGNEKAARLYQQLIARAEQRIERFGFRALSAATAQAARLSSTLGCSVITYDDDAKETAASDAGRRLLCCVMEETSDGVPDGSAAASETDVSHDDSSEGSDVGQHHEEYEGVDRVGDEALFSSSYDSDDDNNAFILQRTAATPCVTSQSAKLYTLCSSITVPNGFIETMHLSSYALRSADTGTDGVCRGTEQDEQQIPATETTAAPCALAQLNTADVGVASMEKHLKADFTKDKSNSLCSSWYGFLEKDRHVIVCQPAAVFVRSEPGSVKAVKSNAPFFVAVVQDDGEVVVADEREEEDEGEATSSNEDVASSNDAASAQKSLASRVALCQVTGMEGVPLRVSISRARSFCVIVGVAKYVVVSLYDDDY
ncbi:hypothetical protein ABB37_05638 [Leptomonas pyrrhocoris]|uniref:Anaphase-promoting complex subunit 4 WD40 domain-containing protein n=1 Tax=Leptomonas pyrrhocoris TaxID=157538 RepID=A0A0M9FZL5_LEPPY|nr:hypothetical protein ABB37_05638 [Leptomonas pyrrhocoris]XP_015657566.1 hypothetical protein ABB37_05638 [Leptomonas pyrrhocoris]KPA79126.1 hypothetical protein ABB37_05638 [Leptomonas pyrrhocoris]KPA79127.1 hypothetical protein ABB37_05638 [Leptomonas pyrrhocoris]|eukprot:XP_015657565.1 hypothetical protein ABB37_05638 [Leptomonas pyrrhocoris]